MTREEHLKFCKVCKNNKFDFSKGIVCGLTNETANFEGECSSFEENSVIINEEIDNNKKLLDNSNRATIAINVFGGLCVVNLLAIIFGYFELELLKQVVQGENFTQGEVYMNDLRQGAIGFVQSVLYITTIVTFLNWFRRAYGNLERAGIELAEKESMAVWSFFIPILSLYKPYTIAKEIVLGTRKKLAELDPAISPKGSIVVLGLWWALFLITNWVGHFAFRSILKNDTAEQMINSAQVYMFSDFLDIPAAILTLLLIRQIAKDEKKLYDFGDQIISTNQLVEKQ